MLFKGQLYLKCLLSPYCHQGKMKHLTKGYQFNYFLPHSFSNFKEDRNLLWILLKCRFRISRFRERLEPLYLILYFNWKIKNLTSMQKTWDWSLGWEDPLEKEMTTHSSIIAWRIPRTEAGYSPWGWNNWTWLKD